MKRNLKAADISRCIPFREVTVFEYAEALEIVKPQAVYSNAFLAGEVVDYLNGHFVFDAYYTADGHYFWGGIMSVFGFAGLAAH
jgi:hypothetical protein